jgi:drug/metabolite transporter (DMT)-like permease
MIGDLMCLGSQLFAASYFVFFSHLIARYGVLTLMKWLFTISAVVTWPLFAGQLNNVEWACISSDEWLSLSYIVIIGTFVCYLVLNFAQGKLEAPVVASYNYIQPVVATLFSLVWGVGVLSLNSVVAAVLILGGVWLVGSGQTGKKSNLPRFRGRLVNLKKS